MLLLLAIGACTSSEEEIIGSIYGKVTDSKNGKVLQGVTITLIPGGLSRTTGSDGTYEFLEKTKMDSVRSLERETFIN